MNILINNDNKLCYELQSVVNVRGIGWNPVVQAILTVRYHSRGLFLHIEIPLGAPKLIPGGRLPNDAGILYFSFSPLTTGYNYTL